MQAECSIPADVSKITTVLRATIVQRYAEAGADRYGIQPETFTSYIWAVVLRYAEDSSEEEKLQLISTLRVADLVLARACSAGNATAWDEFMARFRAEMHHMALQITRESATGQELADGLYAELYGLPNRDGRRVSKLDYYMGRGSLQGWLRTVLTQRHIDRCRTQERDVSLDEQVESGVSFAARPDAGIEEPDGRVSLAIRGMLEELSGEERFLLVSYYLDQSTLAMIGKQLGVHESTVSRKMEKLTGVLRKRLRTRLESSGIDARRCEELLDEMDVRDLNLDIGKNLRQET